eukprot:CAMPEP_0173216986 /NCGR_PEP_ID=MMETSP1142-20121109/232_1 /TAXON_ID=483371 /ORGANISM="non described non described, Strain CCMP2298" /LENGTH=103 /DNA_ID=CAMNT_0014144491 /DNA_START=49 /DNA_END=357 /DNA_ORIENTATION=+
MTVPPPLPLPLPLLPTRAPALCYCHTQCAAQAKNQVSARFLPLVARVQHRVVRAAASIAALALPTGPPAVVPVVVVYVSFALEFAHEPIIQFWLLLEHAVAHF